jgi:hypothetical protein
MHTACFDACQAPLGAALRQQHDEIWWGWWFRRVQSAYRRWGETVIPR